MSRNGQGFLAETLQLVRAVGRAMGVTLRNLGRKPVTVMYPDVQRQYPDRFRGILALTYDPETGEENCIGCRLCEYICPPQVIKVEMLKQKERNYAKSFTLELYSCEFCELCVQVCPTDAIVMLKTFDLATSDRRELLLDKDRLHALGLQYPASWATGNRLRDMQAPPKAAKAESHGKAEPAAGAAAKPATPAKSPGGAAPKAAPSAEAAAKPGVTEPEAGTTSAAAPAPGSGARTAGAATTEGAAAARDGAVGERSARGRAAAAEAAKVEEAAKSDPAVTAEAPAKSEGSGTVAGSEERKVKESHE